jgi:hypothetical protein
MNRHFVIRLGQLTTAILLLGGSILGGGSIAAAPTNPRARAGMAVVTAPGGSVLLFGGDFYNQYGSFTFMGDTWAWDGISWALQYPVVAPSPRCCAGAAYDPDHHVVVLYGGCDENNYFSDTWTWDGSTWAEQHPASSPPAGCGTRMAYDEARHEVVMFGGEGIGGTWTWDGTTWTEEQPATSLPWRERQGMAYDAVRHRVVVFGGEYYCFEWTCPMRDTWTWNGSDWKHRHPARRPWATTGMGMAFDESSGQVVMFGGTGCCGLKDSTWTWNGTDWTRLEPLSSPSPREAVGMAPDGRGGILLFGGRDEYGYGTELGDTWGWDGSTWACLARCG